VAQDAQLVLRDDLTSFSLRHRGYRATASSGVDGFSTSISRYSTFESRAET